MQAASPPFGQADLTNCERELIHLAGSVQPHGVLIAVDEAEFRIVQLSVNVDALLGVDAQRLLHRRLDVLGGDLDAQVRSLAKLPDLAEPVPLRCTLQVSGELTPFEGSAHRVRGQALVIEIEPTLQHRTAATSVDLGTSQLSDILASAVQSLSAAGSIGTLADAVVRTFRDMVGYDRVMVYKFDPDGHGQIIAEARDPRLESLLGHHYPASDIPQRARELYIRNRLRVLVDVHYEPALLTPPLLETSHGQAQLDMSMCYLRSMSPLHLQYLKNMGVTATLVVSLVREGKLWGLIACHHYSARNLRAAVRSAADLLAEVVATRIGAIENYANVQVAIQVRRLEQRLIEATSTEGDWRLALFRSRRTLLQPLGATGAALLHEGELMTTGEVPSTAEVRALIEWIGTQPGDGFFSCSSVVRANPAFAQLTPTASGVLAVRLSTSKPDYLVWFRKEQLVAMTWGGDPSKPVVGNNPLELSPRRSFAAWSEIVRDTAVQWSAGELALARAFASSLIDIIVQVNAVRLLIAEHQMAQIRDAVERSNESVVITDATGAVIFTNRAFELQAGSASTDQRRERAHISSFFDPGAQVTDALTNLTRDRRRWQGELALLARGREPLPVAVRADAVSARDGSIIGFFLIVVDLTATRKSASARRHLESSLASVFDRHMARDDVRSADPKTDTDVMSAMLANASLAAMDIADGNAGPTVAALLEELENSTQRAVALHARIKFFG